MTDLAPHELNIWEMARWSEADADAAVARYEQAGPEAIEWLELQVGQRWMVLKAWLRRGAG